jgi:ferritin
MLKKKIEDALNHQVLLEGESSHFYLAMASWAEVQGYSGTADFFYGHSDEERMHMIKLVHYINERAGTAVVPAISKPNTDFSSLVSCFEQLLEHEVKVTESINELVFMCLEEKDYTTHNFLQWYVAEQLEEEALARTALDRVRLVADDKSGVYLFDRDINTLKVESAAGPMGQ